MMTIAFMLTMYAWNRETTYRYRISMITENNYTNTNAADKRIQKWRPFLGSGVHFKTILYYCARQNRDFYMEINKNKKNGIKNAHETHEPLFFSGAKELIVHSAIKN